MLNKTPLNWEGFVKRIKRRRRNCSSLHSSVARID
jgi:hypothetical protein